MTAVTHELEILHRSTAHILADGWTATGISQRETSQALWTNAFLNASHDTAEDVVSVIAHVVTAPVRKPRARWAV